ncbi:hypothetical protein HHI36_004877 [Cryptolaemus montrouzieri]|uniref:CCHC-type domain-containing protein n=1 Tax=Cryptolaemus montrouzieri TaxID=559131 RepID=A0ABD2NSI7_9CUCU
MSDLEIDSPGTSKTSHKSNFLEPELLGSSSKSSFHFKDKNIDKFYKNSSDWKQKNYNPTVSAIESDKHKSYNVRCWNCGTLGHTYSECRVEQSHKFCYRCVSPNVTTRICKKCRGN